MAKAEKTTAASAELVIMSETERLRKDIYRSDIEKLQLFTRMLRTNQLLKKAVIHHK